MWVCRTSPACRSLPWLACSIDPKSNEHHDQLIHQHCQLDSSNYKHSKPPFAPLMLLLNCYNDLSQFRKLGPPCCPWR
jgi:hypothetical protein